MNDKKQKWYDMMKARGHTPIMHGDELDTFVYDHYIHNGPGCSVCGWSTCWHCNQIPGDVIPQTCKR